MAAYRITITIFCFSYDSVLSRRGGVCKVTPVSNTGAWSSNMNDFGAIYALVVGVLCLRVSIAITFFVQCLCRITHYVHPRTRVCML